MESTDYDERRSKVLAKAGFMVLRFWNNEVLENIDGVLERIIEAIRQAPSPPPSPMDEWERE